MTKKAPKDQAKAAKKLQDSAVGILKDVDDALIFKLHARREIPKFNRDELIYGPILGVGGFCVVREIRMINLRTQPTGISSAGKDDTAAASENKFDAVDDDEHYDISDARKLMSKRCLRNGEARYAVKYMHGDLSKLHHARGIIDLAIEAKYLSVVSHPNIIKMRGWADSDPLKDGFFLILDRLYDTLEERMEKWRETKKKAKGVMFGFGANKGALNELLMDRLLVAYDLAAAFRYLHENRLVYRDIKPDNIGFDVRGDVKIFDFGLCKSLSPKLECKDDPGMYKLTARTGSFPYMAPEVATCRPYNCSADVFSFSIMLWEILALKVAFAENLTRKEYYNRISIGGERPPINDKWPPLTRQIMQEAWAADPMERPNFRRFAGMIRADLTDMTHDEEIINRTMHMDQRSRRSMRGLRASRMVPANAQHSGLGEDGGLNLDA